ncbi:hypothetical protein L195_g047300, partial [Trifolium pratense]
MKQQYIYCRAARHAANRETSPTMQHHCAPCNRCCVPRQLQPKTSFLQLQNQCSYINSQGKFQQSPSKDNIVDGVHGGEPKSHHI